MSQESNHFPEQVREANFFYALHDIFRTQEEREEYMQWLKSLDYPPPQPEPQDPHNYNCDGAHCQDPKGEVRRLPLPGSSALIVCRACHGHEMAWRKERNRTLDPHAKYPILPWETLEVYNGS